ncbi:RNA polymerase sigma factor [Acidobacteriota bacterium]
MENRKSLRNGNSFIQDPASRFDALYETYKSAIYSYACYLTKNEKEAEDLFQDTWLRVVQNPPKGGEIENLKSWVFTVTTNLFRDSLRKKRVRRSFQVEKASTSNLGPSIFANERPEGKLTKSRESDQLEARKAITHALSKLPDKLRRVFILKEIEGFKYLEISDILGIPVGTVKSMMHRAINRLRQELAVFCPE